VTEQTRELLSVLMDGEASEIEVHRLLGQMKDDSPMSEVWVSYQETRRVLRRPSKNETESEVQLSTSQHLALHHRISVAVSEDSVHGETLEEFSTSNTPVSPRSRSRFVLAVDPARAFRPAVALAIAASLVVAVFVGMQINSPEGISQQGNEIAGGSSAPQSNPVAVQRVSNEIPATSRLATGSEPNFDNLELKELDEEGQRRLRAYLNQHDRMARMKQNTRLVKFPQTTK